MEGETEEKKKRERKPRSDTHAAALEKFHAWVKAPFADTRDELFEAMLAHKRKKHGDDGISSI